MSGMTKAEESDKKKAEEAKKINERWAEDHKKKGKELK